MALRALLHVVFGITEHLGLIVPLIDRFVDDGSAYRVVFTVAIVNFLYHFLGFVMFKALKVRVRVQLGVGLLIQDVFLEYVSGGHVLELLRFDLVIG